MGVMDIALLAGMGEMEDIRWRNELNGLEKRIRHTITKHPHLPQRMDIRRAQRAPYSDRGGEVVAVIRVDG